ncbi:MAG: restriction endonuclease subunit S, partial [Bdellovibrionota bacterium]
MFRDRLDLTELKSIRVTPQEAERVLLRKGDILVVEGHGNPAELGRCAVWTGAVPDCLHQNHLIRVRIASNALCPEFVAA